MSFTVAKSLQFPQRTLNYTCNNDINTAVETGMLNYWLKKLLLIAILKL